jgi:16S rRNA (guanine966-N2)-methyltransferase
MVKISSGIYRGRSIEVPKDLDVPTKSMVRTAIGNALQSDVKGKRALDLFAGSGAVGIELISRGASYCLFNDSSSDAVSTIKKNLGTLGIENADVTNMDYVEALSEFGKKKESFDIIFLDPPYAMKEVYARAPMMIATLGLLSENGILIEEYEGEIPILEGFRSGKTYNYGRTHVVIYRR